MQKIFIAGIKGFVGQSLSKALRDNDFEIVGLTRGVDGASTQDNIKILQWDGKNISSDLRKELNSSDIFVHLFQSSFGADAEEQQWEGIENTAKPTLNLLKALEPQNVLKHFIYFSSGGTVYGDNKKSIPFTEEQGTYPKSVYGVIKLFMENIISVNLPAHTKLHVIRPSNIYGVGQRNDRPIGVIQKNLDAISKGKNVLIFGTGSAMRDYIHIDDVVAAIKGLLNNPPSRQSIYNLSSGNSVSLNELLSSIEEAIGQKFGVDYIEQPQHQYDNVFLSNKKFSVDFNWSPETLLVDGIREQWKNLKGL